ncbi:L,D-transpeptidase [Aliiroseovarius sp. KMU-50]|uniref:L,D-transpeptidase n=1 Tax=Aliiroseovarius salicola TaxID=3009082 RepID=A0ABT4VXV8_9RHOB|nr:L,D-transpeptidase [Aliiroseovarius sp. KMU-50]MDA5093098.1 L,D-transpeptidase [Aliiroseovarius sp. KMU-50]
MTSRFPFILAVAVAFILGAILEPNTAQAQTSKKVPRDHGPTSVQVVPFDSKERAGTIIISNTDRILYRVLGNGTAERYKISVGRDGFTWTGTVYVGSKTEWPAWRPPAAMRQRQPDLPGYVPPGPYNPLGARALYLHSNGKDTLYRIHGTNDSGTLGGFETSGCFRLSNSDVMRLYSLVTKGTKVIVN